MAPFIPDIPYQIQFVFICAFSYIWVTAFIDDYEAPMPTDQEERNSVIRWNTIRGILACTAFMTSFSFLKPYLFSRFWRMMASLANIYLCFIIFMLHQRPETGRQIWGLLDPSLNQPVTEEMHTYDDHCEFHLSNIWDNLDHYFAVHWCNWYLASFVIRDAYILHLWSFLDEIVELSWQHILPHFRECWWDHIILDIIMANTPAIFLGLATIKYLGWTEHDWFGRKGKKSFWEWEIWNCHRRFGGFSYMFILLLIHFLTGFFLINMFLIPPKHFFPIARLLLWFGLGRIAFREGWQDISTWNTYERKENVVEGRYRWLCVGTLTTEAILCYKYRKGTGNIMYGPTPLYISLPWAIYLGFTIFFWLYLRFKPGATKKFLEKPEVSPKKKLKHN